MFHYNVGLKIPSSNSDDFRVLQIPNGYLTMSDERGETDILASAPQGIMVKDAQGAEFPRRQESSSNSAPEDSNGSKVVKWAQSHIIWLGPTALQRIRCQAIRKIDVDLHRVFQPKFANVVDPNPNKYRARSSVDLSLALNPSVIGIKGRFPIESAESDAESKPKKGTDLPC